MVHLLVPKMDGSEHEAFSVSVKLQSIFSIAHCSTLRLLHQAEGDSGHFERANQSQDILPLLNSASCLAQGPAQELKNAI